MPLQLLRMVPLCGQSLDFRMQSQVVCALHSLGTSRHSDTGRPAMAHSDGSRGWQLASTFGALQPVGKGLQPLATSSLPWGVSEQYEVDGLHVSLPQAKAVPPLPLLPEEPPPEELDVPPSLEQAREPSTKKRESEGTMKARMPR